MWPTVDLKTVLFMSYVKSMWLSMYIKSSITDLLKRQRPEYVFQQSNPLIVNPMLAIVSTCGKLRVGQNTACLMYLKYKNQNTYKIFKKRDTKSKILFFYQLTIQYIIFS